MLVQGTQTERPLEVEYGTDTIYVRKDIKYIEEPDTDEKRGFIGWEYDETQYSYAEWTKMQDEQRREESLNLMLAVAELAEITTGGK